MEEIKKYNPPGIVWAFLIIAAIAAIHTWGEKLPLDPIVWDFLVLILTGYLKNLSLNSDQMTQTFAVIDILNKRINARRMRGAGTVESGMMETVPDIAIPEKPSKMNRLLWG